eukprot:scaffold624_cov402-Prasinococcus_capsulatus_cf.AAC.56
MLSSTSNSEMSSYTIVTALDSCSGVNAIGSIGLSAMFPNTVEQKPVPPGSVVTFTVVKNGSKKNVEKVSATMICGVYTHDVPA